MNHYPMKLGWIGVKAYCGLAILLPFKKYSSFPIGIEVLGKWLVSDTTFFLLSLQLDITIQLSCLCWNVNRSHVFHLHVWPIGHLSILLCSSLLLPN